MKEVNVYRVNKIARKTKKNESLIYLHMLGILNNTRQYSTVLHCPYSTLHTHNTPHVTFPFCQIKIAPSDPTLTIFSPSGVNLTFVTTPECPLPVKKHCPSS